MSKRFYLNFNFFLFFLPPAINPGNQEIDDQVPYKQKNRSLKTKYKQAQI